MTKSHLSIRFLSLSSILQKVFKLGKCGEVKFSEWQSALFGSKISHWIKKMPPIHKKLMVSNPTSPWVLTVDPVLSRNSPPWGRKGWISIIREGSGAAVGDWEMGKLMGWWRSWRPCLPHSRSRKWEGLRTAMRTMVRMLWLCQVSFYLFSPSPCIL